MLSGYTLLRQASSTRVFYYNRELLFSLVEKVQAQKILILDCCGFLIPHYFFLLYNQIEMNMPLFVVSIIEVFA